MSKRNKDIDRRKFIQLSASLAALMSMPVGLTAAVSDRWGPVLPTRRLGRTGIDISVFGIGGGPFDADYGKTQSIVETAMEEGCRFFETARRYGRGESERGYGQYITPSYRKEITLMSKTPAINAESARRDVEASLESLKTDYIDIYLMHAMTSVEDIENRLKGGVFDELVKAKEEGLIGHVGFSGHSSPFTHNYFIDKDFEDLEVVLMPVNPADAVQRSFVLNTLPKANEKNMGVLGMKIFAGGGFFGEPATWGPGRGQERERVIPDILSTREAQHFALSLPIGAMTIGCHDADHVRENIANVRSYNGITRAQHDELIERVTRVALNNTLEHYKDPD